VLRDTQEYSVAINASFSATNQVRLANKTKDLKVESLVLICFIEHGFFNRLFHLMQSVLNLLEQFHESTHALNDLHRLKPLFIFGHFGALSSYSKQGQQML
jgi:hypothetical protein